MKGEGEHLQRARRALSLIRDASPSEESQAAYAVADYLLMDKPNILPTEKLCALANALEKIAESPHRYRLSFNDKGGPNALERHSD